MDHHSSRPPPRYNRPDDIRSHSASTAVSIEARGDLNETAVPAFSSSSSSSSSSPFPVSPSTSSSSSLNVDSPDTNITTEVALSLFKCSQLLRFAEHVESLNSRSMHANIRNCDALQYFTTLQILRAIDKHLNQTSFVAVVAAAAVGELVINGEPLTARQFLRWKRSFDSRLAAIRFRLDCSNASRRFNDRQHMEARDTPGDRVHDEFMVRLVSRNPVPDPSQVIQQGQKIDRLLDRLYANMPTHIEHEMLGMRRAIAILMHSLVDMVYRLYRLCCLYERCLQGGNRQQHNMVASQIWGSCRHELEETCMFWIDEIDEMSYVLKFVQLERFRNYEFPLNLPRRVLPDVDRSSG